MPRSAWSSPTMMFSNVDLPQPLGPTKQTNSPSAMRSVTSSRACTCNELVWKHLETWSSTSFAACDCAGGCWVVNMSIDLFDQTREIGSRPDETRALRIRDEMLVLVQGGVISEHDAFPCLSNQIGRYFGFGLGSQLLPDHLFGFFRMSKNPFRQFTVRPDELGGQVALCFEKLDARDQHRDAVFG